jgi:hypothetical protein
LAISVPVIDPPASIEATPIASAVTAHDERQSGVTQRA